MPSVRASAGMCGKQLRESTALSLKSAYREDRRGGKGILPVDGGDTQPEAGRTSQTDPRHCMLQKKPQPIPHEASGQTKHTMNGLIGCVYIYMVHLKAMATLVIHIRNHKKVKN